MLNRQQRLERDWNVDREEATPLSLRMTKDEQRRMYDAIAAARVFREHLAAQRKGELFPSSVAVLDEIRGQRMMD